MSTSYEERKAQAQAAAPKDGKGKVVLAAALVALLVLAAVAWAVLSQRSHQSDTEAKIAGATSPPNANKDGSGIVVNPGKAKPGAPTLVVYQDFQCPICKHVEDVVGPTINDMADKGEITLEYRIRSFLDGNLERGGQVPHPKSSLRAAAAASCADAAGVFRAYHDQVFKAQPTKEGDGYTDQQLTETFAKGAGLSGDQLAGFQSCVKDKKMEGFATKMETEGGKAGNSGTPQFLVNGKDLKDTLLMPAIQAAQAAQKMDPAVIRKAILGR
ncbi:DsbA family protein [Arsenicicoccus dermatophilus]|uniref:DsbA family protein n=1 Tax=Arsenicicoccus dermatophilus TaxID=1076331 RepID=UPI0039172A8A